MKPGSRWALRLALTVWLALVLSAGFGTPASAQKNEVAALNAGIAELSRAGKYSEAPRQQLMPAEQALDDVLNAVQRVDARAFGPKAALAESRRRFAGVWMSTRSVTGMSGPATPGCSILRSPTSCMRCCWVRSSSW
jgi:hypothetical protein